MTWLGWLHFGTALLGLATGVLVAVARKGTNYHRQMGWAYVGAMLAVNLTALLIYRLLGHFGPFHVAALFSLATVAAGMLPVMRRKPPKIWLRIHAYWMAGSYVGLWAAAVAETSSRTSWLPFWLTVGTASVLVSVIGAVLVLRLVPTAIADMKVRPARRG
jgi:uncharacterized membrane protein